nr:protein ALP1-like [Coffea arabica]
MQASSYFSFMANFNPYFASSSSASRSEEDEEIILNAAAMLLFSPEAERSSSIKIQFQHFPLIEDCIGALDGTHISATVPAHKQMAYTNRHGNQSQNVLAVCDHDMRFIYVYAGWEGSAHDARVLEHAMRMHTDFPFPPQGKFYLVDAAYKMVPGFLAPFKGGRNVRVGQGRGRGQGPKELFNTRHSQLRNVIERSFGVLKQRFAYLRGPVPYSYMQTQINVVIACCALHNFLREIQPSDDHFMMYEQEDMQFEGECGAPPYPQIQPLTSPQEIEEWKGMRDEMANQMHAASRRRRH